MYALLQQSHVIFAIATIAGFCLRGYWMLVDSRLLQHRLTRVLPHIIDTLFLATGIAMLVIASMNPLTQPWLLGKFVGLVAYVILGTLALRRGPTRPIRIVAFVGAVAVFAWIAGAGLSKSLASWIALFGN